MPVPGIVGPQQPALRQQRLRQLAAGPPWPATVLDAYLLRLASVAGSGEALIRAERLREPAMVGIHTGGVWVARELHGATKVPVLRTDGRKVRLKGPSP